MQKAKRLFYDSSDEFIQELRRNQYRLKEVDTIDFLVDGRPTFTVSDPEIVEIICRYINACIDETVKKGTAEKNRLKGK